MQTLLLFIQTFITFHNLNASYLNYDEGSSTRPKKDDQEFEPITINSRSVNKISAKDINCDDFLNYAVNCTVDAASIYNSSRMSPPPVSKIYYWCNAIRYLTNCAVDWNADCKNVTDSHFNEESINGHIHVVNNICDDEWFLLRYDDLQGCVEPSADSWEACYGIFKNAVEKQKNTSYEWTHYEVHFHLCWIPSSDPHLMTIIGTTWKVYPFEQQNNFPTELMTMGPPANARANFRRCTLESIFQNTHCTPEQVVTLQKFSVIVSEGAVYQDCDNHIMYSSCPGGDPRPSRALLKGLMTSDASNNVTLYSRLRIAILIQATIFLLIYF